MAHIEELGMKLCQAEREASEVRFKLARALQELTVLKRPRALDRETVAGSHCITGVQYMFEFSSL